MPPIERTSQEEPSDGLLPWITIEPQYGWQFIDGRELWRYRDLLYLLVWRDIKSRYAQTVLGVGWAIIQPVFSMVVFTIVFGTLARIPSDGLPYAIFSYAALVPWTYFSGALTDVTGSLVSNSSLLTKVYFPRLIIPFTSILGKFVDFGIALVILAGMMVWYRMPPTVWALALPLLILIMVLTTAGLGTLLSCLAIQYRDVKYAIGFGVQLLLYAAPVVYPASLIPERYRLLYGLNPMAGVIEGFRAALLGSGPMPWDLLAVGSVTATALAISGILYFRRVERAFADLV